MKALTEPQQIDLNADVLRVERLISSIEKLSRPTRESEDVAVAYARLQDWRDENAGRWVE